MDLKLQEALQNEISRSQHFAPCAGANVTIIDTNRGTWSGASGFADVDTNQRLVPNARFYVYSITKTFTAVRLLQLAEQGVLSIDDPAALYLPELHKLPAVTIRQLLNHTSGIPSYTELPDYLPAIRRSPSQSWSYDEVMKMTCSGRLDFQPGDGWRYSNSGYMLLHRLIETVSKDSFAENIRQGIVQPLGLRHTFVATDVDRGMLTPGYCPYLNDYGMMEDIVGIYDPGWCLTGLIVSTTEETAHFYDALFEGELLSEASLTAMKQPVSCKGGPHPFFVNPCYGLGLMIDPDWGYGGFYGHGGDGPGFNTWAMHLPALYDSKITLVVFCNASMGGHPFKLTKNLLRILEGEQ